MKPKSRMTFSTYFLILVAGVSLLLTSCASSSEDSASCSGDGVPDAVQAPEDCDVEAASQDSRSTSDSTTLPGTSDDLAAAETSFVSANGIRFMIAGRVLAAETLRDPDGQLPPECPIDELPAAGTRLAAIEATVTNVGSRSDSLGVVEIVPRATDGTLNGFLGEDGGGYGQFSGMPEGQHVRGWGDWESGDLLVSDPGELRPTSCFPEAVTQATAGADDLRGSLIGTIEPGQSLILLMIVEAGPNATWLESVGVGVQADRQYLPVWTPN